jgi:hypothetical protein
MNVRHVLWTPWTDPGLEHLRLVLRRDGLRADGFIIRQPRGGEPFRVRYRLRCDRAGRVREARLSAWSGRLRRLHLRADGDGRWTTGRGEPVPALDGCIDVDLSATPFTNTLPIRRLGLRPGVAADLAMAYVTLPSLRIEPARQRYTCLRAGPSDALYLYENLASGFRAELAVDGDGVVRDYPGQWRRGDAAAAG